MYISDQKLENSMDLLLIIDENKSHYVYIKDFDLDLCCTICKIRKSNNRI